MRGESRDKIIKPAWARSLHRRRAIPYLWQKGSSLWLLLHLRFIEYGFGEAEEVWRRWWLAMKSGRRRQTTAEKFELRQIPRIQMQPAKIIAIAELECNCAATLLTSCRAMFR